MRNLTPPEIYELKWPAKSRYGIADKEKKILLHSSDSEAWIQAEFWRMTLPNGIGNSRDPIAVAAVELMVADSKYQVVIRI